jgi:hypothetical protein
MEDEENFEEELLLVESELDDIQGMITIIVVTNHESFTTLSSLDP